MGRGRLGTGSTATLFIRELAARKLKIRCVASSDASHELGLSLGMEMHTLAELPALDVYIDGADEVCVAGGGLNLIKGGGGALLREKIVASAAREFIVVADSTKLVEVLASFRCRWRSSRWRCRWWSRSWRSWIHAEAATEEGRERAVCDG